MEILGDFELYRDQPIGKGGGGEVLKGKQVSLNRPVAIKFLNKELTCDESFVRRFRREAECLAKLSDEHIIQIYGAGEHEGAYFFAMEYVPGLSLDKFIKRQYKFSLDDVIYIGIAVAKALKAAWESCEQIIHRDIKPSNIILSFPPAILESKKLNMKEARIKVMDFGLARTVKTEDKDLTISGTIMGTPKYMSPEQGLGKLVDIRSDIYSLGIVLYEIAVGRLPFESDTPMGFIQQHINKQPPLPRTINPAVSPELESIIIKCIQKSADSRYHNPTELLEDLEAIRQKHSPLYAKPNSTPIAVIQPYKRHSKRFVLISILLIILAGLGYVAYLLVSHDPAIWSIIQPNTEFASVGNPSAESILGDEKMKVISHMTKDINNPFDYGIKIKVLIENRSTAEETRTLKVELNWGGKTYFKTRQVKLPAKISNTFDIDFYEPTAGEDYYTYKVLLTE